VLRESVNVSARVKDYRSTIRIVRDRCWDQFYYSTAVLACVLVYLSFQLLKVVSPAVAFV
jgi:hypothetical protein